MVARGLRRTCAAFAVSAALIGGACGLPAADSGALSGAEARVTTQVLKLDAGTETSPVEPGHELLTRDMMYEPARGYGWDAPLAEAFCRTKISGKIEEEPPSAVLVDGVRDAGARTLRVDLPNGEYWVVVTVGDLGGNQLWRNKIADWPGGPVYSMQISANGRRVASDVNAFTHGDRSEQETFLGGATRVAFPASVSEGNLHLTFGGDDSAYQARVKADSERELLEIEKDVQDRDPTFRKAPKRWLGGPYNGFSLLGVEVWPAFEMPLKMEGKRLAASSEVKDARLADAIALLNRGELEASEKAFMSLDDAQFPLEKAVGLMLLAGHERLESERELISEARRILAQAAAENRELPCATELLRQAGDFGEGLRNFDRRAYRGESASDNMFRAEALFRQIPKSSPLYRKAQVYRGRIYGALDPNRMTWMWTDARLIFKELEADIPESKYVKLYLTKEAWGALAVGRDAKEARDIRAPGTGDWREDWEVPSYADDVEGAPAWAVSVRESYRRILDLADWWITNRQIENGEIGGGYSDDVEIVQLWGYAAFINKRVAEQAQRGAKLMVDGVWDAPEIDREKGYFRGPVAWVKVIAEYTGYSQPLMMAMDYGNPVYYERLLKTAKHIRDFATAVNANGRRHFRSGYFNAYRHSPDPLRAIDTALAWRCMLQTSWLSWHSGNKAAEQVMDEWAESWLQVAMSTQLGKPAGVIPTTVSFLDDKVGCPNSPNWYDIVAPNLQPEYGWPQYTRYLYSLMSNVHIRTRDPRFLAPLDLTIELAREGKGKDARSLQKGSRDWTAATIAKMSPIYAEQAAMNLHKMAGLSTYDGFIADFASGWERYCVTSNWEELEHTMSGINRNIRDFWPLMTTELAMTDRIGIPGMEDVLSCYLGGFGSTYDGFPAFSVSYEANTRDFAALVRETTPENLRIMLYSFLSEPTEIGVRPWILPPGANYQVSVHLDSDGDGAGDSEIVAREIALNHRGEAIWLPMPARQVEIIDMKKVGPGEPSGPLADLAMASEDISYEGFAEPSILVTVHNMGGAAARNVRLEVYEDSIDPAHKIGDSLIGNIEAPNMLDAQAVRAGILFRPKKSEHRIIAVVDLGDEIPEVTEENNRVQRLVGFTPEQVEQARPLAFEQTGAK